MATEVPVYLFAGFLESGKTKFIQETLEDERFNSGERTLLLCCEEGECEYEPATFSSQNINVEHIDDPSELNPDNLKKLLKTHRAERMMVEYNGMWLLGDLYAALPENFVIYQQFTFVDRTTFESYNANMRNLMVDKLRDPELVVFNRFRPGDDKLLPHKVVRAANRMCDIAYDYGDGKVEYDDIIDPPPYDINAPVVEIGDGDFAWWYRDILDDPKPFVGKTVRFLGLALVDPQLPKNSFLFGRQLMNCCEADVSFAGFAAEMADRPAKLKSRCWYRLSARVEFVYHKIYETKGPVLKVLSLTLEKAPEQPVASFL